MKDDNFVDAIHEFRGESPFWCINRHTINLAIGLLGRRRAPLETETDAARDQPALLVGSEIGCHEHNGSRKVRFSIVTQRQCRLVQYAEQQLPQSVAGFFDPIEQDHPELRLLGLEVIDRVLCEYRGGFRDGPDSPATDQSGWQSHGCAGTRHNRTINFHK